MAIVSEYYSTRKDGVELWRTYSDAGKHIERDGVMYEMAIDPVDTARTYTETNVDVVMSDTEALEELREALV